MAAPHSLARHFATEAYHNAWANHRLLAACAGLSQEEFVARRTSFFPSIKATLNHILTVDWYYLEALERSLSGRPPDPQPGRFFDPEEPFERCADLAREQHAADRRLIALCESLGDERLGAAVELPRRDGVQRETARRVLAHLFQHQIHHRGQVHAMLAGTPVKPPQLDEFYCASEAALRAADFAELGFSEERIWGETPFSDRENTRSA
ncbi:MAG TPA: DinB family protein [Usitatibacter sp.]|nr:DinB family protein [Usitatibacter sp.]